MFYSNFQLEEYCSDSSSDEESNEQVSSNNIININPPLICFEQYPSVKELKNYKGTKKSTLYISTTIDTEFTAKEALSLQARFKFSYKEKNYVFDAIVINKNYESVLNKNYIDLFKQKKHCEIFYYNLLEDSDSSMPLTKLLFDVLFKNFGYDIFQEFNHIVSNLYLFYSPKDLNIAFGIDCMKRNYVSRNVRQRRGLSGLISVNDIFEIYNMKCSFKIKDVYTLVVGNLEKLCTSFGIPIKNKKSMDKFKSYMDFPLKHFTYKFLEYALDDTIATSEVVSKFLDLTNQVISFSCSPLKDNDLFNENNLPLTIGSLSEKLILKYFNNLFLKGNLYVKICFFKLGILNQNATKYQENKKHFALLHSLTSMDQLKSLSIDQIKNLIELTSNIKNWKFSPFEFCSSKFIIENCNNNTSFGLALSSGGRCVSELYKDFLIEYGCAVDLDIASAYASILAKLEIPIEVPNIIKYSNDDLNRMTLGQF